MPGGLSDGYLRRMADDGFETPDVFETPDGRILRPPSIGEGVFVTGWVVNAKNVGRVVIEFIRNDPTPEELVSGAENVDAVVVSRVWMTAERFRELWVTIDSLIDPGDTSPRSD